MNREAGDVQLSTHFTDTELIYLLTADYKYGFTNAEILAQLKLNGFPIDKDVRTKEYARAAKKQRRTETHSWNF